MVREKYAGAQYLCVDGLLKVLANGFLDRQIAMVVAELLIACFTIEYKCHIYFGWRRL